MASHYSLKTISSQNQLDTYSSFSLKSLNNQIYNSSVRKVLENTQTKSVVYIIIIYTIGFTYTQNGNLLRS